MFRTIIGFVAAVTVTVAAGPAVAGIPAPGYTGGSSRGARLTLSYMADAGYAAAVKLGCDPVGGGHPQGARACAALDEAGGNPGKLPPGSGMCMMIYAPILAEVRGSWHGKSIEWRYRYGNSCEMRRATGVLFDF